jgi:hypothetical protein
MIKTITSNYTVNIPENERILNKQNIYLFCDTRNGSITITLPRISKLNGFAPSINIIDAFDFAGINPIKITIQSNSENIGGGNEKVISTSGTTAVLKVISNNSWFIETYLGVDKMPVLLGDWTGQEIEDMTDYYVRISDAKPQGYMVDRFLVSNYIPFNGSSRYVSDVWVGGSEDVNWNWGSDNMWIENGGSDFGNNYYGSTVGEDIEVWFGLSGSGSLQGGRIAVWMVLIKDPTIEFDQAGYEPVV